MVTKNIHAYGMVKQNSGKAAAKAAEKPLAKVGVKVAENSVENAEKSVGRALANAAMKEGRYASKANYAKWIESMGEKTVKVESGFKAWEKTLPKFKTGFRLRNILEVEAP